MTAVKTPDAFKNDLPTTFKAPAGLEFKVDDTDPLIGQYRTFAHEQGFDQATYSKGLGLIAALRVGEAAQLKTAFDAEVAKLGDAGPARLAAVQQGAPVLFGPKHAAISTILKMAPVADVVEAIEYALKNVSSQGVSPFNTAHRAEPDSNRIPGYDKMSFEQRRQAQDQRRAGATR